MSLRKVTGAVARYNVVDQEDTVAGDEEVAVRYACTRDEGSARDGPSGGDNMAADNMAEDHTGANQASVCRDGPRFLRDSNIGARQECGKGTHLCQSWGRLSW